MVKLSNLTTIAKDVRIWQLGDDFGNLKAQFTNLRRDRESGGESVQGLFFFGTNSSCHWVKIDH